jgi:hypothetical protein
LKPEHSESWLTRVSPGPPYVCAKIICICSKCCPPTRPAGLIVWPGGRLTAHRRRGLPKRPLESDFSGIEQIVYPKSKLAEIGFRSPLSRRGGRACHSVQVTRTGSRARNAMELRGESCKSTVRLPRFLLLGAGKRDVIVSFHFTPHTVAITTVGMACPGLALIPAQSYATGPRPP